MSENESDNLQSELSAANKRIANYEFQISHFISEYEKQKELMERELEIARRIQSVIMPENLDKVLPCCLASVKTVSATEVTGDYYDIVEMPNNHTAYLVTDAVGHGIPAALLTIIAKMIITKNCLSGLYTRPSEIMAISSEELARYFEVGHYLTGIMAILDRNTGTLRICNAGHHPGILFNKITGEYLLADSDGLFLGLNPDKDRIRFTDFEMKVESNTYRLVFFTDGITEAKNRDREEFGDDKFRSILQRCLSLSPKDTVGAIMDEVQDFTRSRVGDDDQTIMIIDLTSVKADSLPTGNISLTNEDNRLLFDDGLKFAREKKYNEAIDKFKKVLEQFPKSVRTLMNIGIVYYNKKDYQEAKTTWETCLRINPDYEPAFKLLRKYAHKLK